MNLYADNEIGDMGQRFNCHFYSQRKGKECCSALRCFYNGDLSDDKCIGCPFFKTEEEFLKGRKRKS
jgi:hypothetical protein